MKNLKNVEWKQSSSLSLWKCIKAGNWENGNDVIFQDNFFKFPPNWRKTWMHILKVYAKFHAEKNQTQLPPRPTVVQRLSIKDKGSHRPLVKAQNGRLSLASGISGDSAIILRKLQFQTWKAQFAALRGSLKILPKYAHLHVDSFKL